MESSTNAIDAGPSRLLMPVAVGVLATLTVVMVVVANAPAVSPETKSAVLDLSVIIVALTAAVLCLLTSRAVPTSRERWAWQLFALAFLSSVVAEVMWAYYELIAKVETPSPSPADIFYLAYYPLAFAGVLLLVRRGRGRLASWMTILDSLVFTLGIIGMSWQFILAPSLSGAEGPLFMALTVAYPLGDFLLIFALCSLFLSWELRQVQAPALLLLASFTVTVFANLGFAWLSLAGDYASGSPVDPLWTVGYGLAALAALSRSQAPRLTLMTRSAGSAQTLTVDLKTTRFVRIILPYLAFPAAAALIVIQLRQDSGTRNMHTVAVVGFALLILGLVMARQFLTLLDNTRLSRSLEDFSHGLERRVAERTEELAAVNRASTALSHCLTTDEVLLIGLKLACDAAVSRVGVVWLLRSGGVAELAAKQQLDDDVAGRLDGLARQQPELARALTSRLPTLLDGAKMPALDEVLGLGDGSSRLLVVPLLSRGSVLGGLGLVLPPSAPYDEGTRQLEEAIGAQLGVAVENAQQYDSARYLAERDSVTGLRNHRSLHKRLEEEFNRAQRTGGIFSLVMMDLDSFKLFNDTYGHPGGDEVLREVASLLQATARDSDIIGRYGGDEFMAILPDTGASGTIEFCQRLRNALADRPFLAPDGLAIPLRLSFGVASYPADGRHVNELIGLADGNLYSSKQHGGDTITAIQEGDDDEARRGSGMFSVLDALVTAVDNKDRYTRHHSEDVTELALAIARQVALSDEGQRVLRTAGLLHDVGKIGVPDRILRKPGRLTEDEMDVVKQHAMLSEIIVKEVPNLTEVMAAVGSHHERWDGNGYPRGLKGAEIPFLGRILAVADAWSAMTTDRPYRKALSHSAAREELQKVAGAQLDPDIVKAFVEIIDADIEPLLAAG